MSKNNKPNNSNVLKNEDIFLDDKKVLEFLMMEEQLKKQGSNTNQVKDSQKDLSIKSEKNQVNKPNISISSNPFISNKSEQNFPLSTKNDSSKIKNDFVNKPSNSKEESKTKSDTIKSEKDKIIETSKTPRESLKQQDTLPSNQSSIKQDTNKCQDKISNTTNNSKPVTINGKQNEITNNKSTAIPNCNDKKQNPIKENMNLPRHSTPNFTSNLETSGSQIINKPKDLVNTVKNNVNIATNLEDNKKSLKQDNTKTNLNATLSNPTKNESNTSSKETKNISNNNGKINPNLIVNESLNQDNSKVDFKKEVINPMKNTIIPAKLDNKLEVNNQQKTNLNSNSIINESKPKEILNSLKIPNQEVINNHKESEKCTLNVSEKEIKQDSVKINNPKEEISIKKANIYEEEKDKDKIDKNILKTTENNENFNKQSDNKESTHENPLSKDDVNKLSQIETNQIKSKNLNSISIATNIETSSVINNTELQIIDKEKQELKTNTSTPMINSDNEKPLNLTSSISNNQEKKNNEIKIENVSSNNKNEENSRCSNINNSLNDNSKKCLDPIKINNKETQNTTNDTPCNNQIKKEEKVIQHSCNNNKTTKQINITSPSTTQSNLNQEIKDLNVTAKVEKKEIIENKNDKKSLMNEMIEKLGKRMSAKDIIIDTDVLEMKMKEDVQINKPTKGDFNKRLEELNKHYSSVNNETSIPLTNTQESDLSSNNVTIPVPSNIPPIPGIPSVPSMNGIPSVPSINGIPPIPTIPSVPVISGIPSVPLNISTGGIPAVPLIPKVPTQQKYQKPEPKKIIEKQEIKEEKKVVDTKPQIDLVSELKKVQLKKVNK